MAQFIPVDGQPGPEESLFELIGLFANNGRQVSFEKLENSRTILSHLDTQKINGAATKLASGRTIYGDAMIFSDAERSGD